ncbi:hypothetical protein GCM10012275_13290 [Longimycelium tulufanense]|uniref:Uncharacterized protein n=1 Tax=Longimycelium tulufanense TaxID=907463 RepID=A0A8J3CDE4_9PSEU|nr:hypothetical protein GCM10012275_13290 [Longimycelium tulufanense]
MWCGSQDVSLGRERSGRFNAEGAKVRRHSGKNSYSDHKHATLGPSPRFDHRDVTRTSPLEHTNDEVTGRLINGPVHHDNDVLGYSHVSTDPLDLLRGRGYRGHSGSSGRGVTAPEWPHQGRDQGKEQGEHEHPVWVAEPPAHVRSPLDAGHVPRRRCTPSTSWSGPSPHNRRSGDVSTARL